VLDQTPTKEKSANGGQERNANNDSGMSKENCFINITHGMQNGTLVVTVGERNYNKNDLHNGKDNHDLHDKSKIKENRFVSLEGTKYSETSKENHKNSTADEDNSVCDISSSNSNIVPIGTSRKN